MKLSEMIKVMQHYADGGKVEYSAKKDGGNHWAEVTSPSWDWAYYEYRIKEQIQKVTIEKWLCQVSNNDYVIVESSAINKHKVYKKVKLLASYEVEL